LFECVTCDSSAGTAAVTSTLVIGAHAAILIDAQFGGSQAQEVVDEIRKCGKTLTQIYISAGDPDYYFGVDRITGRKSSTVKSFRLHRAVARPPRACFDRRCVRKQIR